jgi:hypothetical protein
VANPPQSWINFRDAQGNIPNEVGYADIEPAVRKHEGSDGDLTRESHYKFWYVSAVKKGTDNDPAAKLEKLTQPPETSEADCRSYINNLLGSYLKEVNGIWNDEQDEPPSYLEEGKFIDWTYPD